MTGLHRGDCRPFIVDGEQVGVIRPDVLKQLFKYPEVFCIRDKDNAKVVELNPAFRDYNEKSENVDRVLRQFRNDGIFVTLKGWRDEVSSIDRQTVINRDEFCNFPSFSSVVLQCYEVKAGHDSLLKMDRSATCMFGIRNYGVDINGYVRHPQRGLCIWLQQRSDTKQTWPGKWDNMVGGGLSVGFGIKETAIKEAAEEASIPTHLVKNLVSAGCVSFLFESERGIFPNTEFVFDLELPVDFVPSNSDGEVQAFELLPANECLEKLFSPDFKTTSCPVVIDFLIRHGVITPENGEFANA